jgi:hypothetical protein
MVKLKVYYLVGLPNVVTARANARLELCKLPGQPIKCCHCLPDRRTFTPLPPNSLAPVDWIDWIVAVAIQMGKFLVRLMPFFRYDISQTVIV